MKHIRNRPGRRGQPLPPSPLHEPWVERRLRAAMRPWADEAREGLAKVQDILAEDRVLILYEIVCLEAQKVLWPKGHPIHVRDLDRASAVAAGVVCDVICPCISPLYAVGAIKHLVARLIPSHISAMERVRYGLGKPRDKMIDTLTKRISRRFGPPTDASQLRDALQWAAESTGTVEDRERLDPRVERVILDTYFEAGGGDPSYERSQVGEIQLLSWPLRDYICRRLAGKRKRENGKPTSLNFDSDAIADPVSGLVDTSADQALDAVDSCDEAREARARIAARAARASQGTIASKVTPFLIPFLEGEISGAAIAREIGHAPGAVHAALTKLSEEIGHSVRPRKIWKS